MAQSMRGHEPGDEIGADSRRLAPTVVAADSLAKRDVFRLPDPFAVITIDGEQTNTTTAIKVSFETQPPLLQAVLTPPLRALENAESLCVLSVTCVKIRD